MLKNNAVRLNSMFVSRKWNDNLEGQDTVQVEYDAFAKKGSGLRIRFPHCLDEEQVRHLIDCYCYAAQIDPPEWIHDEPYKSHSLIAKWDSLGISPNVIIERIRNWIIDPIGGKLCLSVKHKLPRSRQAVAPCNDTAYRACG